MPAPVCQIAKKTHERVPALHAKHSAKHGRRVRMTEDQLEQEALSWLADVGWQHRYGPDLAPDGIAPERDNYRQVLLIGRLRQAVAALNPDVPQAAREDAVKQVVDLGTPVLLAANRQFHRLLVTGVPVQYQRDGETRGDIVRLVD